jgi:DNA-binding MarR family transcriptional regulator
MREIWIEEGLSQRELSERVGTAESTTVSALRVLERRKFIFRKAKLRDRRTSRVYLTDLGKKMRDELMPIIAHVNRQAVRGMSKREVEALSRSLAKIRANLKKI